MPADDVRTAQALVFENDDLFFEVIRPTLPDAADVEARHGTEVEVHRPELRARAVMAFRLRRLDKRAKRLVDAHCETFVRHVHHQCMLFRSATHQYANSMAEGSERDPSRLTRMTRNFQDVLFKSVWPTLLFDTNALQLRDSLDHLNLTRIPSSLRDVYHLAAGDCAVCGWHCNLQLESVPVWHQPHDRTGECLPFTSHDHFVEVCFMDAAHHLPGSPPAMQLRVDGDFTSADFNFLSFLHAIRETSDHDVCIRRLFAERRVDPSEVQSHRRKRFIVHLPLFRLKLGSAQQGNSSIAELFGKTDAEMRSLIMHGNRMQQNERRNYTVGHTANHVVF
jgi:hypothetical protein